MAANYSVYKNVLYDGVGIISCIDVCFCTLEESILFSPQFTEYGATNCPEFVVSEKKIDPIVLVAPAAQPNLIQT
jgi:hypothetical protein